MCKQLVYCSIAYSLYCNKINGQIQAWRRLGFACSLLSIELMNNRYCVFFVEGDELDKKNELFSSSSKKKAVAFAFKYLLNAFNSYDTYIYIRRLGINLLYTGNFFKKTKSRIIYEIPTYPIDCGTSFLKKLAVMIEQMYFNVFVYPNIDAMPAFVQKDCRKHPSKLVSVYNAVNVLDVDGKKDSSRYTFLFVGNLQKWHGLESVIKLVVEYKGTFDIELKIYSSNTDCYQDLLSKYSFSKRIHFCGRESMKNISQTVTRKTIGIGGLDYSERGASFDTSLKNKDYAAMGIPFVYTLKDLSFIDYPYGLQISKGDVNNELIDRIVLWHQSIESEDLSSLIQEYARMNLTYDKQVETVYRKMECNT